MSNTSLRYIAKDEAFYVELDLRDGTYAVTSKHDAYRNSSSMDEHHGHIHSWTLPNNIDADKLDAALASNEFLVERARRALAGYENEWNGNNHVARTTDDADQALEDLTEYFETVMQDGTSLTLTEGGLWDASDWLGGSKRETIASVGLTAVTTDAEAESMARRLVAEAEVEGVVIDERETEYLLLDWRDELPETAEAA